MDKRQGRGPRSPSRDRHFTEVLSSAFSSVAILGGGAVLQFLFDLVMARTFDADGVGRFYLSLSVLTTLGLIGRFGLDRAMVRFVPPEIARGDIAAARGVVRSGVFLSLVTAGPLAVGLFVLANVLARDVFDVEGMVLYLRVFACALPAFSLMYILGGVLRAMKWTRSALSVERVIAYLVALIAVIALGRSLGLEAVVIAFAVGCVTSLGIAAAIIRRKLSYSGARKPFNTKLLAITAAPMLFVVFATQMYGQLSVLILGATGTTTDVGIFNIALKLSLFMSLVLSAINARGATKISEMYHAGDRDALKLMLGKVSTLGAVYVIPVFIVIALIPELPLSLFGEKFTAGATALIILAAGQVVNVSVGSTTYALAMTGHERALAVAVAGSLALNVGVGLAVIPSFGVNGAAAATAISVALSNLVMVVMVRRYLGVWMLPFTYIGARLRKARSDDTKTEA